MKIYDNFNIFTSKLLDQRCKVEYVSDLMNIEFYTDGLLVWVSSINQFYVYSEQEDGWIPLPVVAPTRKFISLAWSDNPFTEDTNDDSLVSLLNDSDILVLEFI